MQKELTDIDRMIMESHYLNALEIESRAETPLSEMERQDYIGKIQSQAEMIAQFKVMLESLQKVLDAQDVKDLKQQELIASLTA